ncbi:hypothetical protein LBMAG21_03500 [Armatimonadota bacterium]|nr:hypothetical protein LBMAG21_03500 [Armatimonadota bacterium]
MAELTPEEREHIYLEEKERYRAKEKIKKENARIGDSVSGCASAILLLLLIAIGGALFGIFGVIGGAAIGIVFAIQSSK